MIELLLLLVSILLVIACGIFVAAEFSLIASNRTTVERLAAKGDVKAQGVLRALTSLSTQLSSAQVGITITNLGIGFLAEPAIARLLEGPLISVGLPESSVPGISIIVGITLATIFTMIFGELIPKNLAIARPLATAKVVQGPQQFFTYVMRYPIKGLNGTANYILHKFGVEAQEELASARSADELLSLVRRSAEKGTLAKETALLLERSLNFGDLIALDVMTPRVKVKAIQAEQTVEDVMQLAQETGRSRFPVYGESLDEIMGIVHIKHAVGVERKLRSTTKARDIMRQPVLVPSSVELEQLLEALRKGGLQIAVVIDEFGGMDGIVTIEDLLEELVGDVRDEHDRVRSIMTQGKDGSWILSGLLRPDEITEKVEVYLPEEEDVETIGGLMLDSLGVIPKVGAEVRVQAVDREGESLTVLLKVERMEGNRIDKVRLIIEENQDRGAKS